MAKVRFSTRLPVPFGCAVGVLGEEVAEIMGGDRRALLEGELLGLRVGQQTRVEVGAVEVIERPVAAATVAVRIEAVEHERWFPVLEGELEVIPLPGEVVEVALDGEYHPPGGVLGELADLALLHQLARETMHRYFEATTARLLERCAERRSRASGVR